MARRDDREYRPYLSEEQRRQPGCPARELCREPRGQDTSTRMRNSAYVAVQRMYAAGLRARYSRTGMPWRVHDETVRIDPTVRHLVPHASESALFAFIKRHVTPGDVVVDVGSFLGVYAVVEARLAGPRGRVVAIEPTTRSASIARRHFAFNAETGSAPVCLVEAAAGEHRRQTT